MLYEFGPFQLDSHRRSLEREGELVPLTPKAVDLLVLLVENAGAIVTKDQIAESVWPGVFIDDSSIAKNISILRRELRGSLGEADPIRTVSKRGYQFVYPVTRVDEATATIAPGTASETDSVSETSLPAPAPLLRRRWFAWSLALIALLSVTTVGSVGFHRWKAQRMPAGRACLVVLDFKNLSNDPQSDWIATALPEALRIDAQSGGDIRFVSADRTAQTERELRIAGFTAYTQSALTGVEHNLDCPSVLSGSYISADDRLRVDMQLLDATTGKSIGDFSQTDRQSNLFQIAANAAAALRRAMKLPQVQAATAQQNAPNTADGLRLYADGLQLLRAGKVPEAQQSLSKAVIAAPDSALAHIALAQAWSQMGFDSKAAQEAQLAYNASTPLPREQKLLITATYDALTTQRSAAIATYTTLAHDYPDVLDYDIGLARAQTTADKAKDSLVTIDDVFRRYPGTRNDPRMHLAKAEAFKALNDYRGELLAAGEAIQLSYARGARFLESHSLLLEGSAWQKLGNPVHARSDFEAAEKISEDLQDNFGLSEALTYEGEVDMHGGTGNSEALFRRALDIESEVGSRRAMIATLNDLATHSRNDANMYAARELYLQALSTAREIEDRTAEANALLSLGNVSLNTGDPDNAITYYNQARDIARNIQNHRMEAIAMGNAANVQFVEGDLNGARKQQEQVLAMKKQIGDAASTAVTLDYLTTLEIAAGNLKAARGYADAQAAILHASGSELLRDQINYCIIAIEEGNPAYAEAPMTQLAAASPKPAPGAEALRVLASSWLARKDIPKARTTSDRDVSLASTSPNIADYLIPASIISAQVDAAEGHPAKAQVKLEALLHDAQRIKNVRLQMEIRLAIGEVKKQEGKLAEGHLLLKSVSDDATKRGFGLIAHKADIALN